MTEALINDTIVSIEKVVKQYNDLKAVDGISFNIKKGEIFGLLGPNGAGKSTLISILCCLFTQDSGKITIDGFDNIKDPIRIKSVIGVVPQEISLYPTLSAKENLAFYGRIYGLSKKALHSRIKVLLDMAGLTDRADDMIEGFSGGMKRRINIAAALLHDPKILFMDEPTTGVDPQSRKRIYDTIVDLNRQGMSVLLSTHQMEDAQKLCHRIGILDKGQLIALDTLKGLLELTGKSDLIHVEAKDIPPNAVESIRKIETVQQISIDEDSMTIQLLKGRELLVNIIDILISEGAKVESINIKEPDLETLFLHLTGTKLRS